MKIIRSVAQMQAAALRWQQQGKSIGFVPTMGALHEGHLSLVRRARKENDIAVVSIFVNPTQFGPKEDLDRYPRPWNQDRKLLEKEKIDVLFAPAAADMYPEQFSTFIEVPGLTQTLCGPFRPGHFRGVATVVAKLLETVRPSRAYFGKKDYQQVRVIARMVDDLRMPVRIIACPTVREADGLAASSRNRYLSAREREEAVKLYQALYLGSELIDRRIMRRADQLVKRLTGVLKTIPKSRIDYVAVVDPDTLEPMKAIRRPALLAAAVWIGRTRLIDNIVIP